MTVPFDTKLPVHYLAACFNNKSTTYKFYWFISILQSVENGQTEINKEQLFARMVANAWYTVNYFHISFGKQDLLQTTIQAIKQEEKISIDEKVNVIFEQLANSKNKSTQKLLKHFNNNVPHWFLRPWFAGLNKSDIYKASKNEASNSLYALHEDCIQIHAPWIEYLTNNARILKDYCYWNLALYLQSKNPNVPDIPNKLIKPATRNSLNNQRTNFWDIVLKKVGEVECIYTGNKLHVGNYAVEHFIPYHFVSHDLIWNLIPADKSFNSTKSDKLPPLDKYFNAFFSLQIQAIEIVKNEAPNNKFLEEYLTIFPDLENIGCNAIQIEQKFKETIYPLVTIASNNGFEFLL